MTRFCSVFYLLSWYLFILILDPISKSCGHIGCQRFLSYPLKNDGWETFLSFWVAGNFLGVSCELQGRYPKNRIHGALSLPLRFSLAMKKLFE